MRRVLALVALLGTSACDQVFDLPPVSGCPTLPVGPAPDDDDADLVANGDDNCPLVANTSQHDEDGDGVGDSCSPCAVTHEESDADCDGIGNACDPDPSAPNQRWFYGFGDTEGLRTSGSNVRIGGDAANYNEMFVLPTTLGSVEAVALQPIEGVYEIAFTFEQRQVSAFQYLELKFGTEDQESPRHGNFVWISQGTNELPRLQLGTFNENASIELMRDPADTFAFPAQLPAGDYVLRAIVTPIDLAGTSFKVVAVLMGPGLSAMISGPVPGTYNPGRVALNIDDYRTRVKYLSHVGPR